MRLNTISVRLAVPAALSLLLACGGGGGSDSGSSTPAATKLTYTDPAPSATNWTLVKDVSSTNTHLVLDLVPPTDGGNGFGIGFTLNASGSAAWSKVLPGDSGLVHNTGYALGSGTQLIKGVGKGGDLIAGVFQKGLATTALPHANGSVASIALDLPAGAAPGTVTLTVKAAQELQLSGMQNVTLTVGTLSAQ